MLWLLLPRQSAGVQVFIHGRKNLNRAVNDDIVGVEILPEDQWSCPSALLVEEVEERPGNNDQEMTVQHASLMLKLGLITIKMFLIVNFLKFSD